MCIRDRCIHAAVDCGITLFDTANQYGAGAAERVLGEALRATPRDRYLIATKLFFPVGDEPDKGLSAALSLIHICDYAGVELRETARTMR